MYDSKSLKAEEFISDEEILSTLKYADENKDNEKLIDEILEKAKLKKGLTHREASVLLACEMPDKLQVMYDLAKEIKSDYYGNRIVLFAPLYLSNYCVTRGGEGMSIVRRKGFVYNNLAHMFKNKIS